MAARASLLLLLLGVGLPATLCDTPANCTYEDVLGSWVFHVGPTGFDRTLDCSKSFSVSKTLQVDLTFPDVASDEKGNIGFWTLIYNQGFEVKIGDRKYFAFSNYTESNGSVSSYCHSTLPGWSHDLWGHNWACYYGEKVAGGHIATSKRSVRKMDLEHKYVENKAFVDEINSKQSLWHAVHYPELTGMTLRDRLRRAGGIPKYGPPGFPSVTTPPSKEVLLAADTLPDHFDWRDVNGVNFVSPVRNQAQCGSCYAFASMAMLESRLRIATNNSLQVVLSTQDVVSCSEYAQGCEGGFPYLIAGKYAEDFGAVEESCFPYAGHDEKCTEKPGCLRYYSTDYHYIGGGFYGGCSEALMRLEVIKMGPFAVSFQVYSDFMNYKGGIYHHTGLEDKFNPWEITNHVVLVVGYGEENGVKYWIVKNSWGAVWGLDGYFKIMRGNDECSIESMAVAVRALVP